MKILLSFLAAAAVLACAAHAAPPLNPWSTDPTPSVNDEQLDSLKKIDKILNDARLGVNPLSGPQTATTFKLLVSGTYTIPANSNGWTWSVLGGTATVNGVGPLPVGLSDNRKTQNAAPITIVTTGTVYLSFN